MDADQADGVAVREAPWAGHCPVTRFGRAESSLHSGICVHRVHLWFFLLHRYGSEAALPRRARSSGSGFHGCSPTR